MENNNELFQLTESEVANLDSLISEMQSNNSSICQGENFSDSCGAVCFGGWCANDFSG